MRSRPVLSYGVLLLSCPNGARGQTNEVESLGGCFRGDSGCSTDRSAVPLWTDNEKTARLAEENCTSSRIDSWKHSALEIYVSDMLELPVSHEQECPVSVWDFMARMHESLAVQGKTAYRENVRIPRVSVQKTDSNIKEVIGYAWTKSKPSNCAGRTDAPGSIADLDPTTRGLKALCIDSSFPLFFPLQTLTRRGLSETPGMTWLGYEF